MTPECDVHLRRSAPEDSDFVLNLRRRTLMDLVIRSWGSWDDDRQHRYAERLVASESTRVARCGGVDIGILCVEEQDGGLVIETIGLLPEYQGQGIGSRLVRDVCREASARGISVSLEVQKANRRARSLYERLGFTTAGETEMGLAMMWLPTRSNGGYRVGSGKAPVRSPFR